MSRRLAALATALLLPVALFTACSDDDGDSNSTPAAEAPADGVDGGRESEAEGDGEEASAGTCDGTTATGTISGSDFTATSAAAVSLEGGKAYTLYLADFDLTVDDLGFSNPEVAEGDTMVMVAVTVFDAPDPEAVEPVAVDDEIVWSDEYGVRTFTVVAQAGDTAFGDRTGAEGTVAVTAVGDRFCGTVEYTDGEKSISGTFEAPAKAL